MSVVSDIFQKLATVGSPPVGEFSLPWEGLKVSETPQICSLAPKWKQIIDEKARQKFMEGVSATELASKLTDQYCTLMANLLSESGLYAHLKSFGITPLIVGGSALGHSGVRSDIDLVFWGNERELDAFAKATQHQKLHAGFGLLSGLESQGINVSRPFRSVTDLANALRKHDIDVVTTLLCPRPLDKSDCSFLDIERDLHQFVRENSREILRQIGDSVAARELQYGAIYTLAEFSLKDSRGGLRDCDVIQWVNIIRAICGESEALGTEVDRAILRSIEEVLNKAKQAWHISSESRSDTAPVGPSFGTGKRRPADLVNYVAYGGRREEFCRLMSDSLGGLLHERDVDEMIYRAALLNAKFVDKIVLPFCLGESLPNNSVLGPVAQLATKKQIGHHLQDSGDVSPYIRELYKAGELGRLFPDFHYAEPFVDRAGFHQFSSGEHHIQTLERVEHYVKNGRAIYPELHDLAVADPAPLYLAALTHDLAKVDEGKAKDHNLKGAEIAEKISREIGFSEYQVERARTLVLDHMIIADLSRGFSVQALDIEQRIRLCDPAYLRELLIFTLADKYASNPRQWGPSKELWLFASYFTLQQMLHGAQPFAERMFKDIVDNQDGPGRDLNDNRVLEFIEGIDKRILSHYSPIVLAKQISVLEKVRALSLSVRNPFELELLEVPGERPLYHVVFSCLDTPGLFGRISAVIERTGMRLTSAYVHTTKDGFACDYLTIEPVNNRHKFLEGDFNRFVSTLSRVALESPLQDSIPYPPRHMPVGLAEAKFNVPIDISIEPEADRKRLMLTISGRIKDDIVGKIAPLLQFEKLNIIGAKLRTGNRQQRYVLYLDTRNYDFSRLNLLESEVREAFGQ